MNMKSRGSEKSIAEYLKVLGSPFRIQLLFRIGYGEACVCHLEATLKKRQAYISQHLMVLRDAGILDTRREGKYIYYKVSDERLFALIQTSAEILGFSTENLPDLTEPAKLPHCECPKCQ